MWWILCLLVIIHTGRRSRIGVSALTVTTKRVLVDFTASRLPTATRHRLWQYQLERTWVVHLPSDRTISGRTTLWQSTSSSSPSSSKRGGEGRRQPQQQQQQQRRRQRPAPPVVEISPPNHGTKPLKSFEALEDERLKKILKRQQWMKPTLIQANVIPLLKEHPEKDVMASSQTGSGKSLMFCLPIVERLLLLKQQQQQQQQTTTNNKNNKKNKSSSSPFAMIIAPTRELAMQTSQVLQVLCSNIVVVSKPSTTGNNNNINNNNNMIQISLATGGASVAQQRQQLPTADILVGTPGRILQFCDERQLNFGNLQYLVIDEADRLLDMGFEPQLTRISKLLSQQQQQNKNNNNNHHHYQSILCSATFPRGVQRLAADFLRPDYYFVTIGRVGSSTHTKIRQTFEWAETPQIKQRVLLRHVQSFLLSSAKKQTSPTTNKKKNQSKNKNNQNSIIVFANTKDDVEFYGMAIKRHSKNCTCRIIHGDKTQSERNQALKDFSTGKAQVLVATDVAARGLDISSIGLVIQVDAPRDLDTYTHRIGRTGRAGASGRAVTMINGKATTLGIARGLVREFLGDKDKKKSLVTLPTWLVGMSHVAQARWTDEQKELSDAGGGVGNMMGTTVDDDSVVSEEINDQFTNQDFRRTASEGSYGAGRDVSYRTFDEEAYDDVTKTQKGSLRLTAEGEEETEISFSSKSQDGNSSISSKRGDSSKKKKQVDAELIDPASAPKKAFVCPRLSKQLTEAIRNISGSDPSSSNDVLRPEERILRSLSRRGSNQRLRFEYIGLFPFHEIYPFLTSLEAGKDTSPDGQHLPRILMVAEKPSIALAIAEALSGGRGPRQRRGISRALPVYEFVSTSFEPINKAMGSPTKCLVTVTSVVGHVFSLGFDIPDQSKHDPYDFFQLPVVKQEEGTTLKLRVVDHLRALAGKSEHLVLWLDCDPEGENIAHEVIAVTRRALVENNPEDENDDTVARVHRARFSSITKNALRDAFAGLEQPDAALSRSVDARQELDLRIGVAFTRLLSWRCVGLARKRFDPSTNVISYGPCQTPTLSFCVDRAREIQSFQPTKYFEVKVEVGLPDSKDSLPIKWKVPEDQQITDVRLQKTRKQSDSTIKPVKDNATNDKKSAEELVSNAQHVSSSMVVVDVTESLETISAPLGLNTVALLQAGSKAMGMSPKQVMSVAEKLYSGGFISYPRTETTKYDPNGFDVRSLLREHSTHENWGRTASYLLRTKYAKHGRPPQRGKDVGDHPPITPVKSATRVELGGGNSWRVYEFVVRTFIGSLHNDLSFKKRHISLELRNEVEATAKGNASFEAELTSVESLGFADSCRWVLNDIGAPKRKQDEITLQRGQRLEIVSASFQELNTKPPRFLQEHELISLMDEQRIGTDASMAVHVNNIVERGYVTLCDETGDPLRPFRPPRPGQPSKRRQIGRFLVPTSLGMSLMTLFDATSVHELSPRLLSRPEIRRKMEAEVKQIALEELEKDDCLTQNLQWFSERYKEFSVSLAGETINSFSRNLCPTRDSLRYWRKLNAFEPSTNGNGASVKQPKHKKESKEDKKKARPRRNKYSNSQKKKWKPKSNKGVEGVPT